MPSLQFHDLGPAFLAPPPSPAPNCILFLIALLRPSACSSGSRPRPNIARKGARSAPNAEWARVRRHRAGPRIRANKVPRGGGKNRAQRTSLFLFPGAQPTQQIKEFVLEGES